MSVGFIEEINDKYVVCWVRCGTVDLKCNFSIEEFKKAGIPIEEDIRFDYDTETKVLTHLPLTPEEIAASEELERKLDRLDAEFEELKKLELNED